MSANDFNFIGLSQEQQKLLTFGGWTVDPQCPHSRPTLKSASELIERGLLVAEDVNRTDCYGCYSLTEYRVPAAVHAAWLAKQGKGAV